MAQHVSPFGFVCVVWIYHDRWLAQTCHPDKHSDPAMHAAAERNFNKIHEAYEVLSDPRQRQLYDDFGAAGVDAGRQLASQNQTPEEFRAQFARYMQREVAIRASVFCISVAVGLCVCFLRKPCSPTARKHY